jgi:plastocyanin
MKQFLNRTRLHGATLFLLTSSLAVAAEPARKEGVAPAAWPGEEMPLPIAVRTPADLALKAVAERQYLIFNLIASGKLAWDRGDFATAAAKWETLLRLPNIDPEIDRVIRPLALDARGRAGGRASLPPPPAKGGEAEETRESAPAADKVTVTGTVAGGGTLGPGGTVVWLKRADGSTPRPAASRNKVMHQSNKTFVPRVLPVTVGSKVDFRNQDAIFHNVFSLSRPNEFDAGLYKGGQSYQKSFNTPGPVQILCNIHSSMIGYVVVVDTPYYGQADASGSFAIRGVPPGEYVLEAWHESASNITKSKVTVGPEGARVSVKIGADKRSPSFVPDKYGKPRQAQLGY